jgi:hypothetical protein
MADEKTVYYYSILPKCIPSKACGALMFWTYLLRGDLKC